MAYYPVPPSYVYTVVHRGNRSLTCGHRHRTRGAALDCLRKLYREADREKRFASLTVERELR